MYLRGNLRVRLATQRNSLRKFNLRPLATTYRSVWPGHIYAQKLTWYFTGVYVIVFLSSGSVIREYTSGLLGRWFQDFCAVYFFAFGCENHFNQVSVQEKAPPQPCDNRL